MLDLTLSLQEDPPFVSMHSSKSELSASPQLLFKTPKSRKSGQKLVQLQDRGSLHRKSKRLAAICKKRIQADGYFSTLKVLKEHCVDEPLAQYGKQAGKVARVCCSKWWLRQLTKQSERECEHFAIKAGFVCRNTSPYISKTLFLHIEAKQKASIKAAEKIEAVNVDTGETLDMTTILKGSISNPEVRRAEFMVRCRGFESYAKKQGHIAALYTLTAPSKYHAIASNKSTRKAFTNRNYIGVTPCDTQAYLNSLWKCIRSKFKRDSLKIYGFRVCEPHHDGTPHWHLLLFMKPADEKSVTEIMRKYALIENGDEPGAEKHRFTVKMIDSSKGSATGYIAKYISKNTNGLNIEKDQESGLAGPDAADHVRAWASLWGIRQFQMFGGASVSVWRELRRISECPDGLLDKARQAADASDWEQYVMLQGGADVGRDKQPIKCYTVKRIDPKTREQLINKYGEPVYKVEGVRVTGGESVRTRVDEWIIQRKPTQQGNFTNIVIRENPINVDLKNSVPWSTVNNCTPEILSVDLECFKIVPQKNTLVLPISAS